MVEVKTFYVNPLRECCYVIYSTTGNDCVVVDPGCVSEREFKRVIDFIETSGYIPKAILLTHGHFDHVIGVPFFKDVEVYLNSKDKELYSQAKGQCDYYGIEVECDYSKGNLENELKELAEVDTLSFGELNCKVLHTPGHSRGSVCFYFKEDEILISGDTLFQGSVGRTDLQGGNYESLMCSLEKSIVTLPKSVKVYPGHGYPTTIGTELLINPFLKEL